MPTCKLHSYPLEPVEMAKLREGPGGILPVAGINVRIIASGKDEH